MKPILATYVFLQLVLSGWCQHPVFDPISDEYDVANSQYLGAEDEFQVTGAYSARWIAFSPDGLNMFILKSSNRQILQYQLTVPYDISGAVYLDDTILSPVNGSTSPQTIRLSPDGTSLIAVFYNFGPVQYDLLSPFQISSLQTETALPVDMDDFGFRFPGGVRFNDDGYQLLINVLKGSSPYIARFDLDTPYDIENMEYAGDENSFLLDASGENYDFQFNSSGTKFYLNEGWGLREYVTELPWDLNSLLYTGRQSDLSLQNQGTAIESFVFSADNRQLIAVGNSSRILHFEVPELISIEENYDGLIVDVNATVDGVSETAVSYEMTGEDSAPFSLDDNGLLRFKEPPNFEWPLDEDGNNSYNLLVTASYDDLSSSLPIVIRVTNLSDEPVFEPMGKGFNISSASFAGDEHSFYLGNQEQRPKAIQFDPSGYRMFMIGTDSDIIFQYALEKPFDITGASLVEEFPLDLYNDFVRGFTFDASGARLFLCGADPNVASNGRIITFNLEIPFDISSVTYAGINEELIVPEEISEDLDFNADGTKMFMLITDGDGPFGKDAILEYELSVPYDLKTADLIGELEVPMDYPVALVFNTDGTEMYITGYRNRQVNCFQLIEPYDIKSAVYIYQKSVWVNEQTVTPQDLAFDANGSKMFIIAYSSLIQYDLRPVIEVPENSLEIGDVSATDGKGGEPDYSVTYTLNDADNYIIDEQGNLSFYVSKDYENPEDESNTYFVTISAQNETDFTSQELEVRIQNEPDKPIIAPGFEGFDVSKSQYSNVSMQLGQEVTYTYDIVFDPSGNSMYVGAGDKGLFQYELLAPYDISSAQLVACLTFSSAVAIAFNEDGSKVFTLDFFEEVLEFDCTIPYDLRTAIYSGDEEKLDVGGQTNFGRDMVFNVDGSALFVMENNDIFRYNLSEPFDISSAVYAGFSNELDFIDEEVYGRGMAFSPSGDKLFIVGETSKMVQEYVMTEPFNISGAEYRGEIEALDVSGQENTPSDLVFNSSGTRLFVLGLNGKISEFELPAMARYNESDVTDVLDVDATDGFEGEVDRDVTYSLTGVDSEVLEISPEGVLRFTSIPEYDNPIDSDEDNIYLFEVNASNGYETTTIRHEIQINGTPRINDQMFEVQEKPFNETLVGSIIATDPDADEITLKIVSGNESESFRLADLSLTVLDSSQIAYDLNTAFELTIQAEDPWGASNSAMVTVNIKPIILSAEAGRVISIFPNPTNGFIRVIGVPIGASYVITGTSGRLIQSGRIESQEIELIGGAGIFYLQIEHEEGVIVRNVILKR